MKTLKEVRAAAKNGSTVHWKNSGYTVIYSRFADGGEQWLVCFYNGSCVGLVDSEYNAVDFYIEVNK